MHGVLASPATADRVTFVRWTVTTRGRYHPENMQTA